MARMMHKNCSLGCCLVGSRSLDKRLAQADIDLDLAGVQPYRHPPRKRRFDCREGKAPHKYGEPRFVHGSWGIRQCETCGYRHWQWHTITTEGL